MAEPPAAIRVDDLHKTYANGTKAVVGVRFAVKPGEIYGILGPNGSGKSTIIGVLGTLIRPTSGSASVDGIDVTKDTYGVRSRIGFAMQEAGVDDLATGREYLMLQARLYGIDKATAAKRAGQLFQLFELEDAADKRIASYSGGMKRRIDLAAALIHLPRIIFLDEPTEGLDPRSRQKLWATLKRLRTELHATILLSTHYMEEADHLCDRIAILDRGKIVVEGTPAQLKTTVDGHAIVLDYALDTAAREKAMALLTGSGSVDRVQVVGTELYGYSRDAAQTTLQILRALDAAGVPPRSLRVQTPTLDDVYIRYTGKRIGDEDAAAAAKQAAERSAKRPGRKVKA